MLFAPKTRSETIVDNEVKKIVEPTILFTFPDQAPDGQPLMEGNGDQVLIEVLQNWTLFETQDAGNNLIRTRYRACRDAQYTWVEAELEENGKPFPPVKLPAGLVHNRALFEFAVRTILRTLH